MAAASEGVQPGLRIVALDKMRPCRPPSPPNTDSHVRISREVAHVTGVTTLLGNDPARVSIDVHPDNGASSPATTSALRLDEYVTRHEPSPHEQLHRWVEDVALHESHPPPLAVSTVLGHASKNAATGLIGAIDTATCHAAPAFLVWGARVKALIASCSGPEWAVKVERPQRSEDERP